MGVTSLWILETTNTTGPMCSKPPTYQDWAVLGANQGLRPPRAAVGEAWGPPFLSVVDHLQVTSNLISLEKSKLQRSLGLFLSSV